MKYSCVIFDLDGTILDTLKDLWASTNYALINNGLPEKTLEEVRAIVGNGIRNLIERCVPAGTPIEVTDRVFADFKAHYADHCADATGPYAGIQELLEALKEHGVKTAVVSNKADFAVQELCERFFPGLFGAVAGEKTGIRRKPAPDTVDAALAALGVKREDAVYIGDSEVDIDTAANAGMPCISVLWGFRNEETLRGKGAKTVIATVDELRNVLI